jgi:hypothetical protein
MKPVPLKPVAIPCSDEALRVMRDALYPCQTGKQIQDDSSWSHCMPHWREDEAWLAEQYAKLNSTAAP